MTWYIEVDGLLHGYCPNASEAFEKFHEQMISEATRIWQEAEQRGINMGIEAPKSPLALERNIGGCRDEFSRLAILVGDVPEDLESYVRYMHSADVPGYKYLTSATMSDDHAKGLRDIYSQSGFELKYQSFIESLR